MQSHYSLHYFSIKLIRFKKNMPKNIGFSLIEANSLDSLNNTHFSEFSLKNSKYTYSDDMLLYIGVGPKFFSCCVV